MATLEQDRPPSSGGSVFGLQPLYKSADQAFKEDVAPRSREASVFGRPSVFGPPRTEALAEDSPAPAPSSSNFGRGWDVSGKQLKQTAYGTAALIGDTFGSDDLKKWGLKGYKDAEKEVQAISKESDSFTSAFQSGEIGNWLTYSAGYLTGQFADMAVASGAGLLAGSALAPGAGSAAGAVTGAINKAAVQTGIRGAVGKMIDKEAARYAASGMAKEAAAQAAVTSVYRGIGVTAANTFLNATQELGSIYGEAVDEAAKKGEEYSLGKVWLSGVLATAVDTWADSRAIKGVTDAFKGTGRVSSIAVEALKGGLREGLTEGTQTVIERWGADKDLTSKEAFKEYIDSAAVGVLGGTAVGGVSGAVSKLNQPGEAQVDQSQPNLTKLPDSQSGRTRPLSESDTPGMLDEEFNATAKNGGFMAALYKQADKQGRKRIMRAVEEVGAESDFIKAMGAQGEGMLEYGRNAISSEPDFVQRFLGEIDTRFGAATNLDPKELLEAFPEVAAHLYTTGSKENRQIVRQAVERAGVIEQFQAALADPDALESGARRLESLGVDPMPMLDKFANTQSPAGVFKIDRRNKPVRQAPSTDEESGQRARDEGFTLNEPPEPLAPREQVASMGMDSLPPNFESSKEPNKYGILSHHEPFTMEKDRHQFLYSHKALPNLFFPSENAVFEALRIRKQAKADGTWDPKPTAPVQVGGGQFDQSAASQGFTLKEPPGKPATPSATGLDEVVDVEGAAQTADDAALPKDIRGVKMTQKNKPLLNAYFADEIAALQKKKDGKGKTERLAQLERQALKVGFTQAEVDQMLGRQQAEQSRLTEPKVTRNSPPADPNANWSPTVTLDYGDYTIENDGTAAVYSLKAPVELSSTAKLTGIAVNKDRVTLLAENSKGQEVKVRVRADHIRLEKPDSAAMRDYEFDGSNSADLDRLLGSELMTRLDVADPKDRVGMVLEAVTQRAGLDNLERFSAEFDNMRQGRPSSASAKPDAKPAQAATDEDSYADEPWLGDGSGTDWTEFDVEEGGSQEASKRASNISRKEADDRFEFVKNERPRVLQQMADLKPGDVVVTEDGRRMTVAERLRDLSDPDGSMERVAGFAFDTEDEKGYEFLSDKELANLFLPSARYVSGRGYVLDKPATVERAPAAPPVVETAKSRRLLHFTLPERATSMRKGGKYTFDNDPVHGTGGKDDGPKTGRMAGKRIYLSLDDSIWSKKKTFTPTGSKRVSGDEDDLSKGNLSFDYRRQEWMYQPGTWKDVPLEGVEVDVLPSAKILVIDSEGVLRRALKEVGGYTDLDLPAGVESFWDKAALKYDAVEIRINKRLRETNKFFGAALGSQLVVLNPDVVKISQPGTKPAAKTESRQATDNLKDALANLGDVLTDAFGTKQNITGQRYTLADLPNALTKVMSALIEAGVKNFQEASKNLLERMKSNKDWAPLAEKVDQGMLLKAWNAAGGGEAATKVKTDKPEIEGVAADNVKSAAPKGPGRPYLDDSDLTERGSINKRSQSLPEESEVKVRSLLKAGRIDEAEKVIQSHYAKQTRPEAGPLFRLRQQNDLLRSLRSVLGVTDEALVKMQNEASRKAAKVGPEREGEPAEANFAQRAGELLADGATKSNLEQAESLLVREAQLLQATLLRQGRKKMADQLVKRFGLERILVDRAKSVPWSSGSESNQSEDNLLPGETAKQRASKVQASLVKVADSLLIPGMPIEQLSLPLSGGSMARAPEAVQRFHKMVGEFVRDMSGQERFLSVIAGLRERLASVEKALDAFGKGSRAEAGALLSAADTPENLRATVEISGSVKEDPLKVGLLAERRRLQEDIRLAQESSIAGQARLYLLNIEQLKRFVVGIQGAAIADGADPKLITEAARGYVQAAEAVSRLSPNTARDGVESVTGDQRPALTEDVLIEVLGIESNPTQDSLERLELIAQDVGFSSVDLRRLAQGIMAERALSTESLDGIQPLGYTAGLRAATSLVADFKAKRITAKELETLENEGLKNGDFFYGDLVLAYRAAGVDFSQSRLAAQRHFSARIRLKDYVEQNGGLASAVDAWFHDLARASQRVGADSDLLSLGYDVYDIKKYNQWKEYRNVISSRRGVTDDMRYSADPRKAFSRLLFNRLTLEEARNPQAIRNNQLRQAVTDLFPNLEQAWFSDLAYALRRRPDLADAIFNGVRLEVPGASIAGDSVVSVQEKRAFEQWIQRLKDGIRKESEVAARIAQFEALRNDPTLEAVRVPAVTGGPAKIPEIASTPMYSEVVPENVPRPDGTSGQYLYYIQTDPQDTLFGPRPVEGRPNTSPREYERDYMAVYRGELDAVQRLQDRQRALENWVHPLDRGVVPAQAQTDPSGYMAGTLHRAIADAKLWVSEIQKTKDNPKWEAGAYESAIEAARAALARAEQDLQDFKSGEFDASALDELNSQSLDSILMNAQFEERVAVMPGGRLQKMAGGRVIKGDDRVVSTVEEAASRDAQVGNARSVSEQEMSMQELVDAGRVTNLTGRRQGDAAQEVEDSDEVTPDSSIDLDEVSIDEDADIAADVDQAAESGRARIPSSLVEGLEYRFRRGPGWDLFSLAAVQDMVNELTADWTNSTHVVVLPNAQHLPPEIRDQVLEKLAGSGSKGLYHNGTTYIFSQHVTSEADLEFTLFHEAYGHLGMRAVLGAKFDQFLETAYRTRPEVRRDADAKIAAGMPKLEAIDEVLSDMAAENRNVSIVKQWVGKIISGLREIGLGRVADWMGTLTDAEVASVLSAARTAVQRGTLPAFNGAPSEVRLRENKPPYEMFSTKDGLTTGYARYNPVTDSWAIFTADGADIRNGYTTTTTQDIGEAIRAMKFKGRVEYRLRSGLYVDDKIVNDLVAIPKFGVKPDVPLIDTKYGILDLRRYRGTWDAKRWNVLRRNAQIQFQNEYLPVFEVVEFLESVGRLTPNIDVKTALTLYERRGGKLIKQFRMDYVQPIDKLVKQAGKLGVTKKDIDRYLTARHAFERNAVIASINPGMPDGGSGLTNRQADDILRAVRSSPAGQVLDEIARLTDKMGREKVAYLDLTGMITKKLAGKLHKYDHYVNLSGEAGAELDADDPGLLAGGSKFNVKGKERRALGRGEGNEATDVLSRTIQAYEAALIRGQKNIVNQKVLGLIETNYSPEFAIINAQPRKRQLNQETGEVEEVIDENYITRKDVMVAKVGGIPVTIEFKETGLGSFADAIHGMVDPRKSGPIMEAVGKVNRFLGSLLTTYNPAFVGVNFLRDVQAMYMNSAADGKITKKMARQMIKELPTAIMAAVHEASGGRVARGANEDMLKVLREMQREGGITYFADRNNLEDQVRKIENLLAGKEPFGQKYFGWLTGSLEFLADVSEIAPRLAAYKVMRDNNFSREQSAVFSGDVTVNFNMRGANKEMRQLFLFFNPAVQGSYKLWSLMKTPEGKKKFAGVALGLFTLGFLTSMLGRAWNGEDDDGIDRLDKVPVYKRATSVVISVDSMFGAPLPIPYGWNAFFATGVFAADTVLGKQSVKTSALRIAKTTAEAFSPIGMGASDAKSMESFLAKFVAPTPLLPAVEAALNENRFGAPIRKETNAFSAREVPDAQQYFRGVSPISRAITDGLTELTNGDKYRAGKIDINPATIDFLIQSYLPGVPSDIYKGAGVAIKSARGEDVKRTPWPIVDRFSARIPQGYDAGAYRRASELVETLYYEYSNTRDQARRAEIRAEYPRIGYAHAQIASTKQQLRDVRKQIADLEDRSFSSEEKVRRKNQLMEREEQIFKKAVSRLMTAGEPVREAMMANE